MTEWTLDGLLRWGTAALEDAQVPNASIDAWYLFEDVFNIGRVQFLVDRMAKIDTEDMVEQFKDHIAQRCEGRPIQYIIGYTEFMGMRFEVDERVLIPRQDTEILVEAALKTLKPEQRVLDMCTGSGCIILSLAAFGHLEYAMGADLSDGALKVAEANRDRHALSQVEFVQSDLFEKVEGMFDMIVSNPPYIPTEEVKTLMREVREHEPWMALDGSPDGLAFYRKIVNDAGEHLVSGGRLLFEIGWNQAEDVSRLLREAGYKEIKVLKDLAGLDRVVSAVK